LKVIRQSVPKNFNLFLFGDKHDGNLLTFDRGWEEMINMIESSYDGLSASQNYALDHGDCIDAITTDDPRFDWETSRIATVLEQCEMAKQRRAAIAHKLICILQGNHEQKLHRFGNISKDLICKPLKVRYGTYASVIEYRTKAGQMLFKHYAVHGRKSVNSVAEPYARARTNMRLQLRNQMSPMFGDTLLNSKGHTHRLIIYKPPHKMHLIIDENGKQKHRYTSPDRVDGYIDPDNRWYVNTGSFLRTFGDGVSGYAERAEYPPVELGFAVVRVRDGIIVDIDEVPVGLEN